LYEMHKPVDYEMRLAETRMRLGDLKRFEGDTLAAIDEYKGALDLRNAKCEAHDRPLSDAHFSLAVAYIYLSGEEGQDALACKRTALEHYFSSRAVLNIWMEAYRTDVGSVVPVSALATGWDSAYTPEFVEQLIGDLTETIAALQLEITNPESTNMTGSNTTIGFGVHSSSSVVPVPNADNIFGAAAVRLGAKTEVATCFDSVFMTRNTDSKKREMPCATTAVSEDSKENTLSFSSSRDYTALNDARCGTTLQVKKKQKGGTVSCVFADEQSDLGRDPQSSLKSEEDVLNV